MILFPINYMKICRLILAICGMRFDSWNWITTMLDKMLETCISLLIWINYLTNTFGWGQRMMRWYQLSSLRYWQEFSSWHRPFKLIITCILSRLLSIWHEPLISHLSKIMVFHDNIILNFAFNFGLLTASISGDNFWCILTLLSNWIFSFLFFLFFINLLETLIIQNLLISLILVDLSIRSLLMQSHTRFVG